jgi:hypothetical protein
LWEAAIALLIWSVAWTVMAERVHVTAGSGSTHRGSNNGNDSSTSMVANKIVTVLEDAALVSDTYTLLAFALSLLLVRLYTVHPARPRTTTSWVHTLLWSYVLATMPVGCRSCARNFFTR